MKKIIILSITVLFANLFSAHAQNDEKAKAILQSVSKKINSLTTAKANFSLHLSGGNGKVNETKKGTFLMKGPKYKITLNGQEIYCDAKYIWTLNKEAKEVQISRYDPKEQTISPAKLFTDFYDKEYKYRYVGEKKIGTKVCDVIEMVPLDQSKKMTKIELSVDKATHIIVGGNVWEKNGNKYQYEISNFTPNTPIADNTFIYNALEHPGVEVVDLR